MHACSLVSVPRQNRERAGGQNETKRKENKAKNRQGIDSPAWKARAARPKVNCDICVCLRFNVRGNNRPGANGSPSVSYVLVSRRSRSQQKYPGLARQGMGEQHVSVGAGRRAGQHERETRTRERTQKKKQICHACAWRVPDCLTLFPLFLFFSSSSFSHNSNSGLVKCVGCKFADRPRAPTAGIVDATLPSEYCTIQYYTISYEK